MATIDGKEVKTISYDEKIFVLECGCNRTDAAWNIDHKKYGAARVRTVPPYTMCVCGFFPWIILPEKK